MQPQRSDKASPPSGTIARPLASVAIGAALITALMLIVQWWLDRAGVLSYLQGVVTDGGAWSPFVFVIAKALTFVVAPISGLPFKLMAGTYFGYWVGSAVVVLGDTIGGTLAFLIARYVGRNAIRKFIGQAASDYAFDQATSLHGWRALLVARIALSGVYDFISYAAGLSAIPLRHYVIVTFLAGIPAAMFWVGLGVRLRATGAEGLIGFGSLVLMAAGWGLYVWLRRIKKDGSQLSDS